MTEPLARMRITLSNFQQNMLKYIAEKGGEVAYRFGVTDEDTSRGINQEEKEKLRKTKEGADQFIRDMAGLNVGVINISPIIHPLEGRADLLKITDVGRKVLEVMGKNRL